MVYFDKHYTVLSILYIEILVPSFNSCIKGGGAAGILDRGFWRFKSLDPRFDGK